MLPSYAYWKFDDFSWGETRTVAGGDKGDHSAVEGKFDSSKIAMKRWREWEENVEVLKIENSNNSNN